MGHIIDEKGLKMLEKRKKIEFSDLTYLLFSGTPLPPNGKSSRPKTRSGNRGYPPPLRGKNPLSSFWRRPLVCTNTMIGLKIRLCDFFGKFHVCQDQQNHKGTTRTHRGLTTFHKPLWHKSAWMQKSEMQECSGSGWGEHSGWPGLASRAETGATRQGRAEDTQCTQHIADNGIRTTEARFGRSTSTTSFITLSVWEATLE